MTPYLVERLAELRRHLDHLRDLTPKIRGREDLERDISLHNDVLFSLLTVCQLVIDIAGVRYAPAPQFSSSACAACTPDIRQGW